MRIGLKIFILSDQGFQFMGPGPLRLLERIKEHKSINKAAQSMDLSYVKALKLLNFLEKDMGRPMVVRTRGGNNRGGTCLTPFAEMYIERYRELENNIKRFAEDEFERFQNELKEIEKGGET